MPIEVKSESPAPNPANPERGAESASELRFFTGSLVRVSVFFSLMVMFSEMIHSSCSVHGIRPQCWEPGDFQFYHKQVEVLILHASSSVSLHFTTERSHLLQQ